MKTLSSGHSYDDLGQLMVASNPGIVITGVTRKTFTNRTITNNGSAKTVSLYTVTAGKTFYLTDIYISTAYASELDVQIQGGGVTIFRSSICLGSPVNLTGITAQATCAAGVALSVVISDGGATTPYVAWFVAGVEQ